jgi:hypothetical protein
MRFMGGLLRPTWEGEVLELGAGGRSWRMKGLKRQVPDRKSEGKRRRRVKGSKLRPARLRLKRGQLKERQEAISRRHCGGEGGGNRGRLGTARDRRDSLDGWPEAVFDQVMIIGAELLPLLQNLKHLFTTTILIDLFLHCLRSTASFILESFLEPITFTLLAGMTAAALIPSFVVAATRTRSLIRCTPGGVFSGQSGSPMDQPCQG